jgi:calcium binding protein 39
MASSSSNNSNTPFDWLAGGLFFGGIKNRPGCFESIDRSHDVRQLLSGVQANVQTLITSETAASVAPITTAAADDEQVDPSKFLAARLARVRFLLYDERRETSQLLLLDNNAAARRSTPPAVAGSALHCFTNMTPDLMPTLLQHMILLPFESRKHVAAIFNYLLVCSLDGQDRSLYQSVCYGWRDFVQSHYQVLLTTIVRGHESSSSDIALHCGSMYRSCLRHPVLYRELVGTTDRVHHFVFPFLDQYVHLPNFDVSSDAMESLRLVFTAGSGGDSNMPDDIESPVISMAELAAEFLSRDYAATWDDRFGPKLLSADTANYMTRRVALQILSTVLLTRSNYQTMIRYVASRNNLILIMKLLRDTSPHISLDAFHVFKVFVANPQKPDDVVKILKDNQDKLCDYLRTFHAEREAQDQQFRDEKALIIQTIEGL